MQMSLVMYMASIIIFISRYNMIQVNFLWDLVTYMWQYNEPLFHAMAWFGAKPLRKPH